MMPIYPECKFGIDDSINSIVEVILERLKRTSKELFYLLDSFNLAIQKIIGIEVVIFRFVESYQSSSVIQNI